MSILITGGTGFIGISLANSLIDKGEEPVLFDVSKSPRVKLLKKEVKIIVGDLTLWPDIARAIKENQIKSIFHLGALLSGESEEKPLQAFQVNTLGTLNLLEAARLFDIEKIVFTSTAAVYSTDSNEPVNEDFKREPNSIYGVSKVAAELLGNYYHFRYNLDFRGVRLAAVIGPGRGGTALSSFSSHMIERAALNLPYKVTVSEDTGIPVLYIKDVIDLLIKLHDAKSVKTRIFNSNSIRPKAKEIYNYMLCGLIL